MKSTFENPVIIIAGLLTGINDHFIRYVELLKETYKLKTIDVFVHTWDIEFNKPYIDWLVDLHESEFINLKLEVTSYEDTFFPDLERALYTDVVLDNQWKPYVMAYSLWRCLRQTGPHKDEYTKYIKYKPDCGNYADVKIFSEGLDMDYFFKGVQNFAEPYLLNHTYEDCVFGVAAYRGMLESNWLMYRSTVEKVFNRYTAEGFLQMLCLNLVSSTAETGGFLPVHHVHGPVMWKNIFDYHSIPVIPVHNFYGGGPIGEIEPRIWNIVKENGKFKILDREEIKYKFNSTNRGLNRLV